MNDDLLTDSLTSGIARVFNLKNSKVVTAPSGNKVLTELSAFYKFESQHNMQVILHQAGEVDPTHYVDPVDRSVFMVNHLTLVCLCFIFVLNVTDSVRRPRQPMTVWFRIKTKQTKTSEPHYSDLSVCM